MSVNLSIKEVPEHVAAALRQRAQRNHRSLQGELMAIVEQAVSEPTPGAAAGATGHGSGHSWVQGWKSIEQVAAEAQQRFPGGTPSSVDLIREMRDTRYGDA
jgi:plasmid stability protein